MLLSCEIFLGNSICKVSLCREGRYGVLLVVTMPRLFCKVIETDKTT